MRILFIEDHPYKQGQVLGFLNEKYPSTIITTKNSYNSGLKELKENSDSYDLVLLDISMPNYDISAEESGGDFLPLAGKLILKEMYLREIPTKAIVVTMHGSFEDGTKMIDLDNILKTEFSENYIGYVYFSAVSTEWKNQLENLINKIKK
ncbi:response regulator [Confluentibacter lentus]|uniref:response regulator transcription factor n=1 Tax=Confluentibacter lentus TaxID=1699412 RepID=UPI000C29208C|nr:response regulator transcription factor [Confluentibacter lentus]